MDAREKEGRIEVAADESGGILLTGVFLKSRNRKSVRAFRPEDADRDIIVIVATEEGDADYWFHPSGPIVQEIRSTLKRIVDEGILLEPSEATPE